MVISFRPVLRAIGSEGFEPSKPEMAVEGSPDLLQTLRRKAAQPLAYPEPRKSADLFAQRLAVRLQSTLTGWNQNLEREDPIHVLGGDWDHGDGRARPVGQIVL